MKPRPSWRKATPDEKLAFKNELKVKLDNVSPPASLLNCNDVHCNVSSHKVDLDKYTLELLELVQCVAEHVLPTPKLGGKSNVRKPAIPGWTEEVKPFRDKAVFWHQIWQSCGCPVNTEVHKIMSVDLD